jgi:hypothetical protein
MKGVVIFCFLFSTFVYAQGTMVEIPILWSNNQTIEVNGKNTVVPSIKDYDFSLKSPFFLWSNKIIQQKNKKATLVSFEKSKVSNAELNYLNSFNVELANGFSLNSKNLNSRSEKYFNVEFPLFFMEQNEIYRLDKVVFLMEESGYAIQNKSHVFASNSVLGDPSSKWYKIAVNKDGIVKIDKNWLETNGINVGNLNPSSVHIYGNAQGRLSEKNADPKIDDLKKNAILFVGNNDQNWDQNEYLLFYAWGPHVWNRLGNVFSRNLHIYDDYSYYFIRISRNEPPLYINEVVSSNSSVFQEVSSFNHYDIHEKELVNLIGGGQRWYGELFDIQLTHSFSFNIPNIVTNQPIYFTTSQASMNAGGFSSMSFNVNGALVKNEFIGGGASYFRSGFSFQTLSSSSTINLSITLNRHNPSVLAYLDKIEINARRNLIFSGTQFNFRDVNSIGLGQFAKFSIKNVQSNYIVWDITNRHEPKLVSPSFDSNTFEFVVATDTLREFVCSDAQNFNSPLFVKEVQSQNLHALASKKLLLVTPSEFIREAERLASIHEKLGTTTHVVTTEQIYNEFSGGAVDPTAIRWFAKMFYQRANGNSALMPENLLLFGDGTYDPKNRLANNNYFIPTYQFLKSEDLLAAIVTDDYFGMLDDTESIENLDMMDIGVGRMIVSTSEQASQMINKIEQYLRGGINSNQIDGCNPNINCSSFGDWRLKYVQIADDEESFIINDTEPQYYIAQNENPMMNSDKIYLDAYPQVTSAGGDRYPEVFDAITDRVQKGALIVNYVGHGGEVGAADERVITIPQIESWTNWCNLALFVTATCEFTRFDDPSRLSAGEIMYLLPKGGAIAMMTTTRSVFYNVNCSYWKEIL